VTRHSEGINFKDRLGRCVVMVGVPFPNAHDVVMQQVGLAPTPASNVVHEHDPLPQRLAFHARRSSSNLIENRTMRAVNQSVVR